MNTAANRLMKCGGPYFIGLARVTTRDAILVDVREADEFRSGHIPEAVNAPLSTISMTTLPKNAPPFLYCLRGIRGKRAAGVLKKRGYTVKSIGGINGYKGELER